MPSLKPVAQIRRTARWTNFSRDGRLLVVGDNEGHAQVFDGHTFKPRGRPLVGHSGTITTADFSPDGQIVRPAPATAPSACGTSATGRPLTRQEWGDVLPGRPYRPACA